MNALDLKEVEEAKGGGKESRRREVGVEKGIERWKEEKNRTEETREKWKRKPKVKESGE